jgi:hypothetical protein
MLPRRSGDAEDSCDLVGMTASAQQEPWQKAGARWDAPSVNNVICRFGDFSEAWDAEVIGLNGLLRGVFTPLLELKWGDFHRVNSLSLPLVQKLGLVTHTSLSRRNRLQHYSGEPLLHLILLASQLQ